MDKGLRCEEENEMGVRQRQEAHHGQYGDTTDYFEIYSIYKYIYTYPQILYCGGVFTIFRFLVLTSFGPLILLRGTLQG